jgi:hypothetical protein
VRFRGVKRTSQFALQMPASDFCCPEHLSRYLQFTMGQWIFRKSLLAYPK